MITFADIPYAVAGVTYVINRITILIKYTKYMSVEYLKL